MLFAKNKPEDNHASANPHAPAGRQNPRVQNFQQRLLLLLDGSSEAAAAADYALKLALLTGAELTAAFIIDTATMDFLSQMKVIIQEERENLEQDQEKYGQRHLDCLKEQAKELGLELQTLLGKGRLHQTLLLFAQQLHADAIILHGWTKHKNHTPSSERQLLLELAECPVIVVNSPRQEKLDK